MARSTKQGWLDGDGDLATAEVEDVPVKGQSVKIRALSATVANGATSEAISSSAEGKMKVDNVKLDIIRFAHGVVEPAFTVAESTVISGKYGNAFNRVVAEIVKISGLDQGSVAETEARFPVLGTDTPGENGTGGESADRPGRSDQPARAGGRAGNDG